MARHRYYSESAREGAFFYQAPRTGLEPEMYKQIFDMAAYLRASKPMLVLNCDPEYVAKDND